MASGIRFRSDDPCYAQLDNLLGVMEGEYHWHEHPTEDEFFYVVEGRFIIDLEDRSVELEPGQGFVVPMGVRHRPRAPERTVVLMVETKDIDPIGT